MNLHYNNFPDVDYPVDWLVKQVNFSIGEYMKYIGIAKELLWVPTRLETVSWKRASKGPPDRGKAAGFWVEIEEVGEREDVDVIDDFANAEFVIDAPSPRARRIKVLDADANQSLLCLEREPFVPPREPGAESAKQELLLYLRPNDYILSQQERSLSKLRDRPEPEHRGLIRLLEDSEHVSWPAVVQDKPDSWEFLTDATIEGTDEQRRFVEMALGTPDFGILEGPPGSGKTTTICELIIQEIRKGHRLLLCASTHVAVDNVLEFLQDRGATAKDVLAVRIGDERRISEQVKAFQLSNRAAKEVKDLIERLDRLPARTRAQQYLLESLQSSPDRAKSIISRIILESANLVCGTTVGILQHPDIKAQRVGKKDESGRMVRRKEEPVVRPFDCLIVDEASKTTFQEFLVPALFARKWVLVGDVKQLSPYVEATQVEDNLRGMIDGEDDAAVCLNVFQAWAGSQKSTQGVVVLDPDDPSKYVQQAVRLGLNPLDLTARGQAPLAMDILGSHVILSRRSVLPRIQNLIPADASIYPAEATTSDLRRRHDYWLHHHHGEQASAREDRVSDWANNVAWRLGRSFENRHDEITSEWFAKNVYSLLPQWYDEERLGQIAQAIETIKRIALPSALELIQDGFGRRADSRIGSCLTDGMDLGTLILRHVKLSYQHRMHPQISGFPREFVYDSDSLKDTGRIATERSWSYARFGDKRAGWIQPVRGRSDLRFRNPVEADIVQRELQAFLSWASANPKPNKGAGRTPWEVAILTFYRGQEGLLRTRLQAMFGSRARTEFWTADRMTKIRLGTVDRFQGHEADLVVVSFARSRGIGFLDSPNRLNVAVTRARYQLLLVGNQKMFANHRRDTLLKKLATEMPMLRVAWEGNR